MDQSHDNDDLADDLDEGPLRWAKVPIEWAKYDADVERDRTLRIYYGHSSDESLAELVVVEAWKAVSVTLISRMLAGTYPDGAVAGQLLDLRHSCVEVDLDSPLGGRRVINGATGTQGVRLQRGAGAPPDDIDLAEVERQACPRWL